MAMFTIPDEVLLAYQHTFFCLLKVNIYIIKRIPFANLSEASENRKQKPLKYNKPLVPTKRKYQ